MKSMTDLAVALDFDQVADAEKLMSDLGDLPVVYKVGLELFATVGPSWVRQQTESGKRIFLDLKLYDIPNTVAKTILKIDQMGVEFTTVHLSGGQRMLDQISNLKPEKSQLKILGVSVLTSFQEEDWVSNTAMVAKSGSARTIHDSVLHFASLAQRHSAVSGMVCSPHEVSDIRSKHPDLYLMVPGIRPEGSEKNDQARIMTPAEAFRAGASAIVVGRPITQSKNPRQMTEQILQELSRGK
jgi:orotidine-5'-phosphate decarboxylase